MARSQKSIIKALESKGYRNAYVRRIVPETLALQIKSLREQHGWSQAQLGEHTPGEMKQATISRLENPDNDSYTIGTLTRLAAAFDVALVVHFAPFSELIDWATSLSPGSLSVPSYEEDSALQADSAESTMMKQIIEIVEAKATHIKTEEDSTVTQPLRLVI